MIRHEEIRFRMMRNGIEYGELYARGTPTLRMQSSGEIKISLQGTFLPDAVDAKGNKVKIDWLADEIKPVLVLNGEANPLGVLMPSTVTPKEEQGEENVELQAYDRCWRVRDNKIEGALYLTAGTAYLDAIEQLLTASGIATIIKTPSEAVLAEDRQDWETGTSYLTVVNDLLAEINYNPLWFNAQGFAVLEPASTPTAENIKHIFTGRKPDPRNRKEVEMIRVLPRISRKTDIYAAPNVFLCICSNADKDDGMKATAENNNPQSPLSTMRRGRRIVKEVRVNNIESQAELQAYADRLLFESMTTGEVMQVETMLQSGFGVNDVTAIQYGETLGICVEEAWTMQLTPGGTMSHELKKVVINLG